MVYKKGDDPTWASKNMDDTDWEKNEVQIQGNEIFWGRKEVELLNTNKPFKSLGIQMDSFGEYELFWDGVMIGKNGNPGEEDEVETNGHMWAMFRIPDSLAAKGTHILAIRKSVYHYPDYTGRFRFYIDDYEYLLRNNLIWTAFMHVFAGFFLIASLYFFFLFLSEKKGVSILIFSISCFLFFALIIMEYIKFYVPIHYSKHHLRLEVIGMLTLCIAFLVPLYFSLQFPFPKKKKLLLLYAGVLIFIFCIQHENYDHTAYNLAVALWFTSCAIAIYGVYKKISGAITVLVMILLCGLIDQFMYYDFSLFIGFSLILLGMFYILSVRTKEQRLAYENSLVQSTRLRLELLKKNIQPHFLMNTLTSLIDWVEESPKQGVQFIEALAKEFDLFNQIENKTLIPITQEIELCKSYLSIMRYRKEISYFWEDNAIDDSKKIPPAILHTLVENGITHCIPNQDRSIRFLLTNTISNKAITYTLSTFAIPRVTNKRLKDGTGNKYIKARLTESYGDKWKFDTEKTNTGWVNTITIYN
ncbi:histidine kinase [Aquimarina sp. 2201CG1-2-11]|uniref:histidine kinase n=1 Tax=Aquimarina discodermiae TaxID=3231043 RepID=UPI00346227E2